MQCACFRFYAELNDFLPAEKRRRSFSYFFNGNPSIKDAIEAQGVPHTEVDLIMANGVSVDYSHQLQDEDKISVYPVFESLDISSLVRVRPEPLRQVKFIVDVHLGQLSTYLRMFGFDTCYKNDFEDDELAQLAHDEGRIVLTKDRGLLKRSIVTHGYCVRASQPREQLVEVLCRFDLLDQLKPFDRCIRCNALLESVPKAEVLELLKPKTRKYYNEFWRCQGCGQIYWKGSHYVRMRRFIDSLMMENHTSKEKGD